MKKTVIRWKLAGFFFVSILGTLLHFFFDWTGESLPAAVISAVNESIWEHMKLLFYPMLLFAVIESNRFGKLIPAFWCIKLMGILLGLVLIPVVYYTYTGALGISADWFNITIFFLSAGAGFFLEAKWTEKDIPCLLRRNTAILLLCIIAVLFTLLTFFPPHIPFFRDPVTGGYGYGTCP